MTDERNAAEYAAAMAGARQRLIGFIEGCPDDDWKASPLDGDPRPVGVVVDHVAHSYEYIADWLRQILAGQAIEVSSDIVDGLNAVHAADAGQRSRAEAIDHLNRSGDALIALVAGLDSAQLDADEGRIRRFAQISIRHADDHRAEIEAALGHPG
jgi:DinB superfamily